MPEEPTKPKSSVIKKLLLVLITIIVLVGLYQWAVHQGDKSQQRFMQKLELGDLMNAEAAKPKPPTAKASDTSIHVATEAGNIESVKQAIADGADVNEKNADGVAPLSNAAYFGHKEVVELLITNGADVNAKFDGRTPLDFATHPDNPNKNKAELADLLRKHGGKTGEELKAEGK